MPSDRFDIVVIGSGAGGGTIAHALSASGARILVLERGEAVPREAENWSPAAVWKQQRYQTSERWLDHSGRQFQPYTHYCVGGNTKFWGSVLFRLRREDFQAIAHPGGVSPEWPIQYETLAPYYERAERLYHVHGEVGADPTEPPRGPFPHGPIPHSEEMAGIVDRLRQQGLHPSPLPLGLIEPGAPGGCILCNTCNSFPCQLGAKSDAETCCLRPLAGSGQVTLWTNAKAERVLTDASGRRAEAVDVIRNGTACRVEAPLIIVACGAVNSAALLLRSANSRHPNGLGNSSGLVGRRYMAHQATMMEGFHPFRKNHTVFQKTIAINDFYLARIPHRRAARADPVTRPDARRHGPDRVSVHPGVGIRSLGGARRGLARDVGGSAERGQPGHRCKRRAASGWTTVQTTRSPTTGW